MGYLIYCKNEIKKPVRARVRRQQERGLDRNQYYFYNLENKSIIFKSKYEHRNESLGMRTAVLIPNLQCDHRIIHSHRVPSPARSDTWAPFGLGPSAMSL